MMEFIFCVLDGAIYHYCQSSQCAGIHSNEVLSTRIYHLDLQERTFEVAENGNVSIHQDCCLADPENAQIGQK